MSLKHGKTEAESPSSKWVAMESPLEARRAAVRSWGNQPISVADPEDFEIMEREKQRQFRGLVLLASENFACRAVLEALRTHLTNNYSEGMPGTGYYGGNQYIDQIEQLCLSCKRALALFHLYPEKWGVNIQGYLCTSANLAVYTGLLLPKDRIMGLLDTHLSHGYYTPSGKKVSGASIFFESLPCKANPQTGNIDYGKLEEKAFTYRPRILICSGCSCQREWNSARFGQIADKCVSVLMRGMAHISGLIAAKLRIMRTVRCHITLNKRALYGDNGAISPGGVRIDAAWRAILRPLLSFYSAAEIASIVQSENGKLQKNFLKVLQNKDNIIELRNRVETFATQFAMPAFDF